MYLVFAEKRIQHIIIIVHAGIINNNQMRTDRFVIYPYESFSKLLKNKIVNCKSQIYNKI